MSPEDIDAMDAGEDIQTLDEHDGGEEDVAQPTAEERALQMGWKPKEQYKGNPEHWVDAESFIKKGDEEMPALKMQRDRLELNVNQLQRDIQTILNHQQREIKVREKEAYERAKREFMEAQERAVESGDSEAFRRAKAGEDALREQFHKEQAPATQSRQDQPHPELQAWVQRNPWFSSDPLMASMATAYDDQLAKSGTYHTTAERLKAVENEIKRRFPEKFSQPVKRPSQAENGRGNFSPAKRTGTFEAMPREYQLEAQRAAKRGLPIESFVKIYWEDQKGN